jgi:hypothetical protein
LSDEFRDGSHRHYTDTPCPWPHGMEVEWGSDDDYKVVTILSGSPLGKQAWHDNGLVLCSVDRDGEDAVFLAKPEAVRDAVAAMKARLKKP